MIEVKDAVKSFDGFNALDGLTMTVPRGAIYGLVGPNGAGKSTVIRHIMGIYRQDSGTVMVDDQPVYENPAIKHRMAYIPDEVPYFLQAGTRDMMKYYKGIYSRFDMDRYNKLGEVFRFDDKRPIRKLSRGMQKQAAFRLAMTMRPDVLVLDEPVDGLDPVMRRQIWSLIMGDVAENGTTVLVSSHNLRELEDVCDHVGIINGGKMLIERPLTELQSGVIKVQLVRREDTELPDGLNILHSSMSGRVETLIIRGDQDEISGRIAAIAPVFYDMIPLTLEEIFIYELGGEDYAVRDIIL
jgi:ABC-2 type transport system ATP-binding protein